MDGKGFKMATATKTSDFSLHESPSHLLHRAQQFAAGQSASALSAAGITLRQFSVLAAVSSQEGASQSNLVDETGIDRSTLADMVSRMEGAGLIRRTASKEDARAKAVFLTAKGRKALANAAPAVQEADEQLLAALPKSRRSALLSILSALSNAPEPAVAKVEAPEPKPAKPAKKTKGKAKPAKASKAKKKGKPKKAAKKSKKS